MNKPPTDSLPRLQSALADRYAILRELGRGGTAVVYLARDVRHDRPVAVKLLRPELAEALGAERFLREIDIAAKLQHPHVLGLLDSGQADGMLYYVMPYVDGESLRGRLDRETQLAVDDAVRIAAEVADALGYAHGLGIVHRDIKPENILLSGGHAVVADFGIATALTAAGGEKLTETGIAIGTPYYMSPEQCAGTGKIDGRSDLYALGCVLYEMLAGSPPFTGSTAQSILARHSVDPVPSLRSVRGTVHPGIEWAITKAMAKVPADRFATALEFAEALAHPEKAPIPLPRRRRLAWTLLAGTVGLGVLAGLNVGGLKDRLLGRPSEGSIRSLAVMPVENLTGDSAQVYLADGMTDQLITDLAQIGALRVIGRGSVMKFQGKKPTLEQVARALDVDAVLTASLQREGDSLHVTAQLSAVATGRALWAKSYDGVLGDVLRLQGEVARSVAAEIGVALTKAERGRLASMRRTIDPAVYAAYVKGRYFWNKAGEPNLRKGIDYFSQALDIDPTYALAYSGLADSYTQLGYGGFLPPGEAFPKAKAAATRALELDSTLAEPYASLGYYNLYYAWNWAESERDFKRAIELNPNYPSGHDWYSYYLTAMKRFDQALVEARKAESLDPLSVYIATEVGFVLYYSGKLTEAEAQLQKALDMDSTSARARLFLGRVYQAQGKYPEALAQYAATGQLRGWVPTVAGMGYVDALIGRRQEALNSLAQLDSIRKSGKYVTAYGVGLVYAALGDKDHAFAWLERAVQERTHWLVWLALDPRWDPLRSDPRFREIVRRVGLPA